MTNPIKFLGIIPARKGSKRLPGKNTKICAGKPLVHWTFSAAKKSEIDEVYVSTDCEIVKEIALSEGLTCPGLRPLEISDDKASSFSVVEHVLNHYRINGIKVENIVLLQPTSPLRNAEDINNAIMLFESKGQKPVQSYSPAECPPEWVTKINDDLSLPPDHQIGRKTSQEAGIYYRINGAIYILKVEDLLTTKTFVPSESYSYLMPRERGIDIDEELDFKIADLLLKETNPIL